MALFYPSAPPSDPMWHVFFSNKSSQCGVNHGSQEGLCLMNKNGDHQMAVCQNLVPLVNIKIAGKWMFIPLKMVLIGIDPYPNGHEIIGTLMINHRILGLWRKPLVGGFQRHGGTRSSMSRIFHEFFTIHWVPPWPWKPPTNDTMWGPPLWCECWFSPQELVRYKYHKP